MLKGTLNAPFAPSDAETRAVEMRFAEILGEDVSLDFQLDADLIGGICVVVGGRRYDGSLRASLEDVAKLLGQREESNA